MSVAYKSVQWNAHKKRYDLILTASIALFLISFIAISALTHRAPTAISAPILLLRATAVAALILLHLILAIGPLARLSPLFAPLLYNRRHLGVTMFLLALLHAILSLAYYGLFGPINPFSALLAYNTNISSISAFPFELLGLAALLILFLMAATSHDFWLKNLSPAIWKSLHLGVYLAYALVILHVALGILQSERNLLYPALLALGIITLSTLHILAGRRERTRDNHAPPPIDWLDVGSIDDIPESRAKTICIKDRERVAIFKHEGRFTAVSNTCAHQGGPLGEGKIINGCITCPWHGYQYLPSNGQSPPPFTEKLPTYQLRVEGRRILLNPQALPPGTDTEPANA